MPRHHRASRGPRAPQRVRARYSGCRRLSDECAQVPRPRAHLTRDHGVFAPNFRHRNPIAPTLLIQPQRCCSEHVGGVGKGMSDGEAGSSAPGVFSCGARGGCRESASRSARWARIRRMRSGVSMHAMMRSIPPHRGQCLMSMWTTRLSRCIQFMGGVGGHRHRGRVLRGLRVRVLVRQARILPSLDDPVDRRRLLTT